MIGPMARLPRPAPRRGRHLAVAAAVLPLLLTGCQLLFRPALSVTPVAVEFPAAVSTRTVQVANTGAEGSLLHWEADAGARLHISPDRGTLRAGESAELQLSVDRAGLTATTVSIATVRGAGTAIEVEAVVEPAGGAGPAACDPDPLVRYAGVEPLPLDTAAAAFAAAGVAPTGVVVRWRATLESTPPTAPGAAAALAARLPTDAAALVRWVVPLVGGAWLGSDEPLALARRLAEDPAVRWAELDGPVVRRLGLAASGGPDDPFYLDGEQWWLDAFGFAEGRLAPASVLAHDVVVAVIDTGLHTEHEDLAGAFVPGRSFLGSVVSSDVADSDGHGTHVAGLLAATEANGLGIVGLAAHAGVRVQPIKMFGAGGAGGTITDLANALRWAAGLPVADGGGATHVNEVRVDVVNMSLGTSVPSATLRVAVIDARCAGVLLVAAAGNDGLAGGVDYPARFPEVVAVGSVDQDMNRSYFSDYGEGLVDLMAPGGRPVPVPAGARCADSLLSTFVGGGYACSAGTSMATPLVAGSAALRIASDPAAYRGDPAALEGSLRSAAAAGPGGSSAEYGFGVLCLDALLTDVSVCGVPVGP
jgi:serine protease